MKTLKKNKLLVPAAFSLLILILDSSTAMKGAKEGLEMCLQTVIPSLFPFLFISSLFTSSLISTNLKCSRLICRLYHIPIGAEGILLTGLLGGYPVGARCIAEAVSNGQLSHDDGKRMLIYCNAAGPAFLFGIIGYIFQQKWIPWCLWGIHILSGFCIARLLPAKPGSFVSNQKSNNITISKRLRNAVLLMGEICGWIVLMRILITFAEKWFLNDVPAAWRSLVTGCLELSNGCISLLEISSIGLRFILSSIFLSFGGLCVALQTSSAASNINQRIYLPGKLLQALISFLASYTIQFFLFDAEQKTVLPWLSLSAMIVFCGILLYCSVKQKKSCGILEHIGV